LFVSNLISFFIYLISFLPLSFCSFPNLFRSSVPHLYLTFYLLYSNVFPTAHARYIMASGMIADQWRIGCKQCQWPGSCCRRGWVYEPPHSNTKVPHTSAWFQTLSPLFSYLPFTPCLSLHPCLTYRYTQGVSDRADISNKAEGMQKCEKRIR